MTTARVRHAGPALLAALSVLFPTNLFGAGWAQLSQKVSEFKLANGMRFVVLEQRQAPVVAFHLRVEAGTIDEAVGKTGVSLLLERMFLQGSAGFGSKNAAQELAFLEKAEKHMDLYTAEMSKGEKGNPLLAQDPEIQARIALAQAEGLAYPSPFLTALEHSGAMGYRHSVGSDSTEVAVQMPASRAELWFKMWGEWLRKPSLRAFYSQRLQLVDQLSVRRQDARAMGLSRLLKEAFGEGGYAREPDTMAVHLHRPQDALSYLARGWRPSTMVMGVAGDIGAAEVRQMAEAHFGSLPSNVAEAPPRPEPLRIEEEKRVVVEVVAAPIVTLAWYRPGRTDADDPVFDVLTALLDGRGGLLQKKLAPAPLVRVLTAYPGDREQNLFVIEAALAVGQSFADMESKLQQAVNEVAEKGPAPEDLARARTWLRRRLIPSGPAQTAEFLARMTAALGSFSEFPAHWAKIESVSAADVQRVAKERLAENSRFVTRVGAVGVIEEQTQ